MGVDSVRVSKGNLGPQSIKFEYDGDGEFQCIVKDGDDTLDRVFLSADKTTAVRNFVNQSTFNGPKLLKIEVCTTSLHHPEVLSTLKHTLPPKGISSGKNNRQI
jgi:hypothetical protein